MKIDFHFSDELKRIFELLDNKARLVGGCVRDYILHNILVYDIDIATELLPDEMMHALKNDFQVIPTGLQHGTITVIGEHKYEITTLRTDAQTDGRHAIVKFNQTWETDSQRRDFTINALYLDIVGNVYDYHDGLLDLEKRFVKFIGDPKQRITEDYLRILRFFRFAVRFGNYDEASLKACLEMAMNLQKISLERITAEWLKIVEGEYFHQLLPLMKPIFEAINLNWQESAPNLSPLGHTAFFWHEGALLKFSNAQKKYVANLRTLPLTNQTDAIIYQHKYGKEFISDLCILKQKNFTIPDIPALPICGSDLINIGIIGPTIGIILNELNYIWFEKLGTISKTELLQIAKNLIDKK